MNSKSIRQRVAVNRHHCILNGPCKPNIFTMMPSNSRHKLSILQERPFSVNYIPILWMLLVAATQLESRLEAQVQTPHPDAVPNSHLPGDVDRPELVSFIVKNPNSLRGIVIDETEAELTGIWQYSTHTPPHVGIGYLHDQKKDKGRKSVTYRPNFPRSGLYEVRMSHCYNKRRSTNTPITIAHAAGQTRFRINQQDIPEHDKLFRTLGRFHFAKGKSGWVRISTDGTSGKYVIADSVQFIPINQPDGTSFKANPNRVPSSSR